MQTPALLCPVCGESLDLARRQDGRPASLSCPRGHRYDAARQGHVNLVTGRPSRHREDTPDMVASRESWLAAGHYAPVADALARAVLQHAPATGRPLRVIDTGAGTGYYTRAVLDALAAPGRENGAAATAIDLDLSRAAAQRAAADPRVLSLVWDTWQPWPVPARSAEVLLNVFAPRNAEEFSRVLTAGGLAVVVTPAPQHLAQLRQDAGLLGIDEHKEERLAAVFAGDFEPLDVTNVTAQLHLDPESAADLAHMGPAGHHRTRDEILAGLRSDASGEPSREATLHVRVHSFRRLPGARMRPRA